MSYRKDSCLVFSNSSAKVDDISKKLVLSDEKCQIGLERRLESMSVHAAKKKRIGSRRHGAIQNNTHEVDEFNRIGSAPVAQNGKPEENESINVTIKNRPSTEMSKIRRKLGSSRKRKEEMYVKNLADDVEETNGACETPDTTQLSPAIQPQSEEKIRKCQEAEPESLIPESENLLMDKNEKIDKDCKVVHSSCKTMENMLGGSDKSDTLEGEKLKEKSYFVSTSDLTILNALHCHPAHKQLIGPSNSTQIPEEEHDSVSLAIDIEGKDRYKNPGLLKQFGNFQGNNLLSDSNLKKEFKEDTELEYKVEQEISSSPNEKLSKQERNAQINFPVKDVQHLEDALNKVREEEAMLKEMYADSHSSGNVTNYATEKEKTFGDLIDQPIVYDTYQSDFTLKRTDESATKHDSNSDKKLGLHPSDMNCSETLDNTNDYYINDTKKKQIGDRAETAPGEVYRSKDQVEDHLNLSFEKSIHREQERLLSEIEVRGSSLQTSQSQIKACLEFPPQQNDSTVSSIGNRRKLSSGRRNKGRQLVKDMVTESCRHTKAIVEDTRYNKQLETDSSLKVETAAQENSKETILKSNEVFDTDQTQDNDPIKGNAHASTLVGLSRFTTLSVHLTADQQLIDLSGPTEMPEEELHNMYSVTERDSKEGNKDTQLLWLGGHSSEAQLPSRPADLKSSPYEREISLDDHHDGETDLTVEASNESVGDTLEGLDKSDTLQSQVVTDAHHAEDVIQSELKEGNKSPHEINSFSKSMTRDAIKHTIIISGNLRDQTEVSDTHQYEHLEKFACDYVPNQEVSNPGDSPDVHISDKDSSEALDHTKDDYHDRKTQQISHIDGVVTVQDEVNEIQLEDDFKLSAVQRFQEEKDEIAHGKEVSNSFIENLQSEAHLDFQCQLNNTGFNPMRIVGTTGDNEPLKTTEATAVLAKSIETILQEVTFTTARTEEVSNQIKGIANGGTLVGVCNYTTSSIDSSSREIVNELHEEAIKPTNMQETHRSNLSSRASSLQTPQQEMKDKSIRQPQEKSLRTNEQTHTGLTPTRNRRKLGSSRRNKGGLHVNDSFTNAYSESKEQFEGNKSSDEAPETIQKSIAIKMRKPVIKNQSSTDIKFAQEIKTIRSVLDDKENTEHNSEKGTILSQNVTDSNGRVKTDITARPDKDNKDISEKENNHLSQLTGHDKVKMDLMPSPEDDPDIQNILCHDCNVTATSNTLDLLEPADSNWVQKTEASTCGKDLLGQELPEQQSNDAMETLREITDKVCKTELWNSKDLLGKDEKDLEDLSKRNNEAQVTENSEEITLAELFYITHKNKNGPSGSFELDENYDEKNGFSTEGQGSNSQQGIHKKSNLHNINILQGNYEEKRRKMGQAATKAMDKTEALEELPTTVTAEENAKSSLNPLCGQKWENNETSIFLNKGEKLLSTTCVLQIIEKNMISDVDDSTVPLPGQSPSHNEEVINPVSFVQVTDVKGSEKTVRANIEPSQIDDFTGYEMHITPEITGRNSCVKNPVLFSNLGGSTDTGITGGTLVPLCETRKNMPNEEEITNLLQDQAFKSSESQVLAVTDLEAVKSEDRGIAGQEHNDAPDFIQEPNNIGEGLHDKYFDMKNTSPHLDLTNRRRKMGSTRRNLGSMSQGEHLNKKLDVDNEATDEHSASGTEQRRTVVEMMEHSLMCESPLSPPSEQIGPSTSANQDVKSKTATGRRSRKLGSHRKMRGHRGDAKGMSDERLMKTTETESLALDKISELDESDKKSLGDLRTSTAGEPVSQKSPAKVLPVQHSAEICLGQERQKTFSSVISGPAVRTSNHYNVMMVGDSSVGKTSFMKRAQSGTFSLDLPTSVGLDFWMWTASIDETPVMLQLWDTAGQERFHSITRQIFHKAQAFLLMYDVTSSRSFSAVSYWANCIQEGAVDNVTILLLGNKCDLAQRQVKTQEGEMLAKEYNFRFLECSAATGENVIGSLETVARLLIQRADMNVKTTALHKEPQQKKSPGCC